ncbi:MAG TPA: collagen-like protein [Gaiellaceae bacterium]|nr:collagen-like protein [Gaiellaceae bacterium]
MKRGLRRRSIRIAVTAAAALAIAAGVAYATIPDAGGVYTACKLNVTGTIRLIDPSLGTSTLLGHCVAGETQVTWNQHGQRGLPGATGPQGAAGATGPQGPKGNPGVDGQSVTKADAGGNCANGGVALTAANGTAYVCNGADGAPGAGLSKLGDLNGLACTDPNGNASTVHVTVKADGSVSITCPAAQAPPPPTTDEVTLTPASRTITFAGAGTGTRDFTLTNTGPNTVTIDSLFGSSTTTCGSSLAAGASCTITVRADVTFCDTEDFPIEVTGTDTVSTAVYDVTATLTAVGGTGGRPCP